MTTPRKIAPALIDPPDPIYGSLAEWLEFRDDLLKSGIPHIEPFIAKANRIIKRLSRPAK